MKLHILIILFMFISLTGIQNSYGGELKLYLGLRGGAGAMLTNNQLSNLSTNEGLINVNDYKYGWSAHFKAEAILGFRRFRIGYRFLYNFSTPHITYDGYTPIIDNNRNTTYFNSSRNNIFGHYLVIELAVINRKHFALVPGLAVGTFSGFRVDNNTNDRVGYYNDMHHPFSVGAELNAEIKFGRCSLLMGPNYYLFSLQDKATTSWHQYQHYIGADIGLRVNLMKSK